ncbi:MAG: di-trans,poly-cis-decaprenylcistransferase [Nanoarchaeota archaeon]|nr:di-trans,poly-cis-decaprenylcistransferase [Nanoarchaeota archaeon]
MVSDEAVKHLKKAGIVLEGLKYPKHIAFTFSGHKVWADRNKKEAKEAYSRMFEKVNDMIDLQTKYDIPIITIYLLTTKVQRSEHFNTLMDLLVEFFANLSKNADIFKHKVKISILGKWYDLPGKVIEPIKKIIDETRDYDSFFLNLCVNYDGQDELVDACKLILRRVLAEKADLDTIDQDMIKDNLYSSYFLPPNMIVRLGKKKTLKAFLLWDSTQSTIYFNDIFWQDFDEKEFLKAIKYYQDNI